MATICRILYFIIVLSKHSGPRYNGRTEGRGIENIDRQVVEVMNSVIKAGRKGTEEKGQKLDREKASESTQFLKTHHQRIYVVINYMYLSLF